MMLVCNSPDAVAQVLGQWEPQPKPGRADRIAALLPSEKACNRSDLSNDPDYRVASAAIVNLLA
jgi:hypothetical protein